MFRVNSLSNTHNENKSIRFKTPMLRSNLCNYSDVYILVILVIDVYIRYYYSYGSWS